MSVKKFLILTAAGAMSLAATSVFAGGPDIAPPPDNGVYFELSVGYAGLDWADHYNYLDPDFYSSGGGGFTFGADLGYQFNQYFGLELGWFWLPRVRYAGDYDWRNDNNNTISADNDDEDDYYNETRRIQDWFAYLAAKFMAPVAEHLNAYFKFGVAYRRTEISDLNDVDSWRPIFGGGFQYYFDDFWSIKLQWLHLPEGGNAYLMPKKHYHDHDHDQIEDRNHHHHRGYFPETHKIPAANLFTVGVEYLFAV